MSATLKLQITARTDAEFTGTVDGTIETAQVSAYADYADGANKEWAAATPAAYLQLTVRRDIADREGWVPGAKVTVTIGE